MKALLSCNKAIELEPEYTLPWVNKGLSLTYLDRDDEAIACF